MNPPSISSFIFSALALELVNSRKATHLEELRYSSELLLCVKLKLSTPRPRALMTVLFTPTFYSNRATRFNQRRFSGQWVTGSVALCSAPEEELESAWTRRQVYSVRCFIEWSWSSQTREASRGFLWLVWRTAAVHFTLIGLIISRRGF